jgi:glucose/arabinose dehydrogenase
MSRAAVRRAAASAAALLTLCAAAVLASAAPAGLATGDGDGGVAKQVVASGFQAPVYVTTQPDESDPLYVVEQDGLVKVVVGGVVQPQPFLDLTGRTGESGERGLLSIAFDPAFATNGLFYAYYTNNSGDIELDEFHANSDLTADPSSRREVITIPHPGAPNHNGGTALFGPDGYLYLGTGDGGGAGDPPENAQNKHRLLGKLLRIDPHGADPGEYAVPRHNPFVGRKGRNEIYALGLRNPFRFSFDSVTGRIAIGDVGQDRWEEIDYESHKSLRAANFGWDHFEGDHLFDYPGDNEAPRPRKRYRRPIHNYPHSEGNVITGGIVVRDSALPTLYGRYLYADFGAGELRSLKPALDRGRDDGTLGVSIDNPTSFWEAADGTVYVTSLSQGTLYRLVPQP